MWLRLIPQIKIWNKISRHASFGCVIYDTVRGCISTIINFMEGGGCSEPSSPNVSAEAPTTRHATLTHENPLTSSGGGTLHFFSIASHFTGRNWGIERGYRHRFVALNLKLVSGQRCSLDDHFLRTGETSQSLHLLSATPLNCEI